MNLVSNKEKAQSINSLLCLLQGCIGYNTIVELRNDDAVHGVIKQVDGLMNVSMTNVTFTKACTGQNLFFEDFYIQGKHVRYVHIPDELDIIQVIKEQLGLAERRKNYTDRQPKKKKLTKKDRKMLLQKRYEKVVEKLNKLPSEMRGRLNDTNSSEVKNTEEIKM